MDCQNIAHATFPVQQNWGYNILRSIYKLAIKIVDQRFENYNPEQKNLHLKLTD
jgi:hypothetical protein